MQWKKIFVSKMLSMESWVKPHFPQPASGTLICPGAILAAVWRFGALVSVPDVKAVPARQTQAEHMSLPNLRGSILAQPPAAWAEGFLLFPGFRGQSATIRWCDKGDGTLWIGKKAQRKAFVNISLCCWVFPSWGGNRGLCLLLGLWEQLLPLHTPQLIRKWLNQSYRN